MIAIRTEEEIEKIRGSAKIAVAALLEVKKNIYSGISPSALDCIAEKVIVDAGAYPAFKGYRGYRYATCISVNEQIVHGIPVDKPLNEGDIVGIDVGVKKDGYFGDVAETIKIGRTDKKINKLVRVAKESLMLGIAQAKEGKRIGDISYAIQSHAEKNGFSVVRDLFGHGVGTELHEDPLIPNYGRPGEGIELKTGMVFAIEPMINQNGWKIKMSDDGWTIVTADGGYSAHFEHTIAVGKDRAEILTKI